MENSHKLAVNLGWLDGGSILFYLDDDTEYIVPADHLRAWLQMRDYLSAGEAAKKEMLRAMGLPYTPPGEEAPRPTRGIMLCMDGRESTPINIKLCGKWYTGLAEDLRAVMEESRVK